MEIFVDAHFRELESRRDHSVGGVAVAADNSVGKRAVVCADAYRAPKLFTSTNERHELRAGFFDVRGIFGFGIVGRFARALFVGEIAWVDADFFDVLDRLHRRCGQEVNVGDERSRETRRPEFLGDVPESLCRVEALRREADDLAARFGELDTLFHRSFDIAGFGVCHRLHDDVSVADYHSADVHLADGSFDAVESGYAIFFHYFLKVIFST